MSEYDPEYLRKKEATVAERAKKLPNLLCFIEQFPLAMVAISEVHDYERGPLVKGDYRPSLLRHLFGIDEHADALTRKKKVAWNAIADLEIAMQKSDPLPGGWEHKDAHDSYFEAIRAIGEGVKVGTRELPDMFKPGDITLMRGQNNEIKQDQTTNTQGNEPAQADSAFAADQNTTCESTGTSMDYRWGSRVIP